MAATFDRADIVRSYQLFHDPGDVVELRIPEAGRYKTISGYFDNSSAFADAVIGLADEEFAGYYFTLNEVNPALIARSANTFKRYAKNTTSDADITGRRWLPVDFDVNRPAGISSTDEEHTAALEMARNAKEWLISSKGWPENAFIWADSGNGGHLDIKIDLPNDEGARKLIEDCLSLLGAKFSDETVKVDATAANASRVWKIYGTVCRKGSNTADRPHRLAKILAVPKELVTVPREKLEELVSRLPKPEPIVVSQSQTFDPVKYATDHGAKVAKVKHGWVDPKGKKWTLAILEECPFDSNHNRGEAWVGVADNGERGFGCPHNGCVGNDWHALRQKWESPIDERKPTFEDYNPPLTRERCNAIEAATGIHTYNAVDDPNPNVISEEELKQSPKAFNPKLEVHLEPGNFISKYMAYAKTTSDAYEEYHFASGIVLLSVAADRQIVISMRHGDIYPNIWIFPIGDSTVSRKTTAYKLCKLILKSKYPRKSLPSSFSPEALMDAIASTPRCYYLKDEAGSLLASLCKDYMQETRDFLAEIYECDDYYRKLKKSECSITSPYITQMLMTTPDNLKEYTTPLDLTSGWLLRYLWMYPNYPKEWKPFAEKDSSDFDKYTTIYGEYNEIIQKLAKPRSLSLTADSMQFFQTWQQAIEEEAMENADNITKALAGRLMTYVIKMAALFTIGREDFDENSKIELPHIQEAARLIESYFLPIGKIIVDEVARAESKNVQDKIIGTLKRYNGRISQRDLLRVLHMKLKEVEEAIEALILSEEIERQIVKTKKGKVLYYVLRECISDIVSHNEVYKRISNDKNNTNLNNHLYTPHIDTKTLLPVGQDGLETELRQATEHQEAKEEHFKTPIKCSSCGKDITNKTQLTKNGKTYCKGCGDISEPKKDCGSCPVALQGDKSAIKCNPCIYVGRAEA
jgi:hypothetical protein